MAISITVESENNTTSTTMTINPAGSYRVLVVMVGGGSGTPPSAVALDAVSLTKILDTSGGTSQFQIWRLFEPAVGLGTITLTGLATLRAYAFALSGVNVGLGEVDTDTVDGITTPITVTGTGIQSGDRLFAGCGSRFTTASNSDGTLMYSDSSRFVASYIDSVSTSASLSYSSSGGGAMDGCGIVYRPATEGGQFMMFSNW